MQTFLGLHFSPELGSYKQTHNKKEVASLDDIDATGIDTYTTWII